MPTMIGSTKAVIAATANTAFLVKFSLSTIWFFIIASIRLFKFAPVTPDTQTTGAST